MFYKMKGNRDLLVYTNNNNYTGYQDDKKAFQVMVSY
jgi:hypothetical protein